MTTATAEEPALTLVSHHLCPYVQRAAIMLAEKGVSATRRDVDLSNKPDWFSALSPLGKVPLLIVRQERGPEVTIFESAVICEYLDETQPGPALLPRDPLDRARHRSWIAFGSSILSNLWGFETARDATTYETRRQSLREAFARVDTELNGGPYFAGTRFSLVDAVYAPIFRYFDVFDTIADTDVFTQTTKVQAWRRALAERPSVQHAAASDYAERLRAFLADHDAHLLRLAV